MDATAGRVDRFEDQIERRFDKVDERFDKVDEKFGKVDLKIQGLATKDELAKIDKRLDGWGKADGRSGGDRGGCGREPARPLIRRRA